MNPAVTAPTIHQIHPIGNTSAKEAVADQATASRFAILPRLAGRADLPALRNDLPADHTPVNHAIASIQRRSNAELTQNFALDFA
jgi:hypothetical protein